MWPLIKRTFKEFQDDNMSDWAAALTYYGLLSLFPALIALVSIVGLVADPEELTKTLTEIVTEIGPETGANTFAGPIQSITGNTTSSLVLLILGTAVALNAASGYVGAYIRAANVAWEMPEGRSFFKLRPLQLAITLLMVLMLIFVLLGLALTGPIVEAIGEPLGISGTVLDIWEIAKWPIVFALSVAMFATLNYLAPNVRMPRIRVVTPGSIFTVAIWIIASALFALFVANFGSYDKTYGTLGGVVTLLVWLWITNMSLLFGLELNAELERSRQIGEGVPHAEEEIQLEPRTEPDHGQTN